MKKLVLFSLGAALALSSCSKNESVTPSVDSNVTFTSSITSAVSRVTSSSFEDGDAISVYANDGSSYVSENVKYESVNGVFASSTPIVSDGSALSFVAVYPYASDMALSTSITVAADQSTESAYEASDILSVATASTTETCPELVFAHSLSQVIVNITSAKTVSSVAVNAANTVAADFAAGTFASSGSAVAITPLASSETSYKAVVAPQTIAAGTDFIALDINGETVVWTITEAITLQSGYTYNCNVTVADNSVSFAGDITEWTDGGLIDATIGGNDDVPQGDGYQGLVETVFVEAATFTLGYDGDSCYDATPSHEVTLTKSYYIGKCETTQSEWNTIMGANPAYFTGDNYPVERITWYDVVDFCNALSAKEGLDNYYSVSGTTVTIIEGANGYRLPTEAEWEYAARGGKYSEGYLWAGSDNYTTVAWMSDNAGGTTHEVGTLLPNELGLYDMSGNVFEWCYDLYSYYSSEAQVDPIIGGGTNANTSRIVRSGCYNWGYYSCRVCDRASSDPSSSWQNRGFRIARTHID